MSNKPYYSSITKKIIMSLMGLFLITFLLVHLTLNSFLLFDKDLFNEGAHFMGTNPLVQFLMQPILIFGVVFHFVMGFVLELRNRKAVGNIRYVKNNGAANSTWMSRNMIYSGLAILAFIALHFIDFWIPEIKYKYVEALPEDPTRYYHELVEKFQNPLRVAAYVIAFVFLALHLLHGFMSAFQSMGLNNKFTKSFERCAKIYSIAIPGLFIFIALFHYFNH